MTPILQVSSQEPSTSSKSHLLLSQPNHVGSSSNFQDISHIIYQHDLWCKRWPQSSKSPVRNHQYPPSLKGRPAATSCLILIKLIGYLNNHLPTWSMMSKMTPSSKSPVRNPQRLPSSKWSQSANYDRSSSNFQDIFLIIHQHDPWCQRWPHPSILQSGTINILQATIK